MTIARKVYKSEDKGHTWLDITGTLPDVSVNDIAYYDRGMHDALYVGTNVGVFFRDNTMDDWMMFSNGLPAAILVTEIEIYHDALEQEKDMIRASSYGRGLWESPPYYDDPVVDFEASDTNPSAGCGIDFTDLSTGYPMNWEWTFEGGSPASSSDQNPGNVIYLTPGSYFVKLVASNPSGTDSLTKTAYINVGEAVAPTAEFMADNVITCPNSPVAFTDLSEDCPTSWDWSFDPSTIQFVQGTSNESQHPVVEFSEAGEYSVTLTVSNDNGSNSLTKEYYIMAGGYDLPFVESFTDVQFGEMEWFIENPDGQNTWEEHYIEWEENDAMRMVNWGYFNQGDRDKLISPPVKISGYSGAPSLGFRHAYAQRSFMTDSLIVYVSGDCGTSWTRIWAMGPDGNGIFATSPNTGYSFEPASQEDWCGSGYGANCFVLDLSEWIPYGTIRLMFENYNGFGNNLYLDDIIVEIPTKIGEPVSESSNLKIFPNPNQGRFTLYFDEPPANGTIQVYDLMGRIVHDSNITAGQDQYELDLSNAGKGMFVVEVSIAGEIQRLRVLVK
jgi:PKD repeat protein